MARAGAGRTALRSSRVTLVLIAVLLAVYTVEVAVWLALGRDAVAYAFLATATPTPGWLLAPFAHSLLAPLHLLTSVVVVAVYGGLVEGRLPGRAYLLLYVAAGYAATAAQVASYAVAPGPGTFGASGAALALVGFVVVDAGRRWVAGAATTTGERVFAATGVAIVALRVARDLGLAVPAAEGTAPVGHVTGVLVGVAYAAWRAA